MLGEGYQRPLFLLLHSTSPVGFTAALPSDCRRTWVQADLPLEGPMGSVWPRIVYPEC